MRPAVLLAALGLCSAAEGGGRSVYWYGYLYAASDVPSFAKWAKASGAVDSVSLCCGYGVVAADGSFAPGAGRPHTPAVVQALRQAGIEWKPWSVISLSSAVGAFNDSQRHAGAQQAADWAAQLGLGGMIVDYEPASNYSAAHRAAYAAFLDDYSKAAHAKGVQMGADIAGWGILNSYDIYSATAADLLTSMSPTYQSAAAGEVDKMLAAIPAGRLAVGISRDSAYWNATSLGAWVDTLVAKGVRNIHVWPPTKLSDSPEWFLQQMQRFRAAP